MGNECCGNEYEDDSYYTDSEEEVSEVIEEV